MGYSDPMGTDSDRRGPSHDDLYGDTRLSDHDDQAPAPSPAPVLGGSVVPLVAGVVLGDSYRLTRRLGEGGMGEVWQAEHLRLPKAVAIKVLLPSVGASGEALARFKREAEIGARLAHPNIVHVFDFNQLPDGRQYLVMEFLGGEPLSARLERGAMPLQETVAVLEQAARGLRVAHEAGVVHRDLKPDNLFLVAQPDEDPPWRVKVLDFGISKMQSAEHTLTRDMTVMGTPSYMAPEQALGGTKHLGPQADQFALATIAYEMLTGQIAFRGTTLAEVVYKVVQETPPPVDSLVPGLPPRCGAAIARAMDKDPDARFPDIAAFVDAFTRDEPAVSNAPPVPPLVATTLPAASLPRETPGGTSGAAGPGATNKRVVLWAAGLLAVALLAGTGAVLLNPAGSPGGDTAGITDAVDAPPGESTAGEKGSGAPSGSSPQQLALAEADADSNDDDPAVDGPERSEGGGAPPSGDASSSAGAGRGGSVSEAQATASGGGRAAKAGADDKPDDASGRPRRATGGSSGRRLPPEAQRLLDQADDALESGDYRRARRLAQQSFRERQSAQAREVMAKSFCHERNLSLVNARLRGLPRAARRRVASYCERFGIIPAGSD
jgi:serine/threonine-protein kinase